MTLQHSTLEELAHLLIQPARLTIQKDLEVGSGGYGDVCLATLDGVFKVAVKQLRIVQVQGTRVRVAMVSPIRILLRNHYHSNARQRLARELKVWAKANHPNVLRLNGYYLSDNYACAQLVSPYMANGNIMEYIKRTQAGIEARTNFANVLISDEPDAVLCDFGLATFVEESSAPSGLTTSQSTKGSLRYMSPELFQDDEAKHSLESDIWAWACTIFESASPGSMELLNSLAPKADTPLSSALITLQTLIPECWDEDPGKRPSSSHILERLQYAHLVKPDLRPAYLEPEVVPCGYPEGQSPIPQTLPKLANLLPSVFTQLGSQGPHSSSQAFASTGVRRLGGESSWAKFHDYCRLEKIPFERFDVNTGDDSKPEWFVTVR
ncbi:hypothetical protein FRC00_005136, partial [Tulasnella sp. 408]